MKRFLAALLAIGFIFSFAACTGNQNQDGTDPSAVQSVAPSVEPTASIPSVVDDASLSFGVLKGPTGIGAAFFMDEYSDAYDITLAGAPTELVSMVINGELDIACLPSNLAATLYNQMDGGIQTVALVTKGVLHLLENGDSIKSVSDLNGKTIYATGQASNPEYILNYILTSNGLVPGVDVTIEWRDSEELSALAASGEVDLCMLPEPAATSVTVKNAEVRYALDLTKEWDSLNTGSGLYMTCVVVQTDVMESNPEAVSLFMERYIKSVSDMEEFVQDKGDPSVDPGSLLASLGIVGSAEIGNKSLPRAALCTILDKDIKPAIEGYFQVLYDANPTSIGGAVPSENFYCETEFIAK